jgi:hypothetical protein
VSEPLTLEDDERVPPFVAVEHSDPAPWAFIRKQPGAADLQLKLAFRSQDLGDEVVAFVYIDAVPGESTAPFDILSAAPGGFGEERTMEIAVPEAAFYVEETQYSIGCHAVSVSLAHASNIDRRNVIIDKGLSTRVTWWVEITAVPGEVSVAECPHLGVDDL